MLDANFIRTLLNQVEYLDWEIHFDEGDGEPWLQVRFNAPDLVTKKVERQHGRKWKLSYHMTKSEIVNTAWKAVLTAVEHEAREAFRYRGRTIYGPHFDVDVMHEVATQSSLDVRTGEWVFEAA
jgi:hypothetical protein